MNQLRTTYTEKDGQTFNWNEANFLLQLNRDNVGSSMRW